MNFLGIGSGLDLSTMLTQLVQVASEPKIKQLGAKEVETRDSISGLGTLSSLLSKFKDASDALKDSSSYNQRTAGVIQPASGDVLSVTADSSSVTGYYDITVEALAKGTKGYTSQINTDHTASLSLTDTLTFSVPDGSESSFAVNITSSMSLNDIRDAINDASDNFGVTVNVVDGQLVYSSSITGKGVDKQLKVEAMTDSRFDLELDAAGVAIKGTAIQGAQQAEITVDGIVVNSNSNTFDSQISGLTIVAKREAPGELAALSVDLDVGSVKSKITAFSDAYNELRSGMNELKGYFDDDGEFVPGKLNGDPILRNLESVLGGMLTQVVSGASDTANTLYSVGLDITEDGLLSIDSTRLDSALTNSFSDLDELFSGTNGLAYNASDTLDNYLGFTGIIKGKEDSYNDIIKDLEAQYDAHAKYIESYQKTLKMQFAALDSTMAKLNSTMSFIGPQLQALSGNKN